MNGQDPNTANIYNEPTFRRMYWRALQELVNGPLSVANSGPLLDAKYNTFVANGLSVEDPNTNIKPWLSAAHDSIASQLASENATNFTVNSSVVVSNDVALVSGTAPVEVATIWFNGTEYPVTWTSVTNWTALVPLHAGTNQFSVAGVDRNGQPIAGDTNNVTAVYGGTAPSPAGQVVINEIMYNPPVAGAEYVELYNTSGTITFDLSGWQVGGLSYTFPAGSLIGPGSFVVLAANRADFAAAYGATNPVFDTFSGTLPTAGEILSLTTSNGQVVTQVRYQSAAPWPTNADGTGASLQLIDPLQDNWRAGNWTAIQTNPGSFTPGTTNSVAQALAPFAPLWLNELQADNLTGIANSAGQRTAWLELYNPSTNSVSLNGLWLANNYTNLAQWPFPANAVINPGQFKVIFADGLTNLSTPNELHTSFTSPARSGSLALSRFYNAQFQVLDFIDYTNLPANYSYGSFPDGQSFIREQFFAASPGGTNDRDQPASRRPSSPTPPPARSTPRTLTPSQPGCDVRQYRQPGHHQRHYLFTRQPVRLRIPGHRQRQRRGPGASPPWPVGLAWPNPPPASAPGSAPPTATKPPAASASARRTARIRALGLLATSTTGFTAFGAKFINETTQTLNSITVQFTGEVWRQSDLPKTLQFYYLLTRRRPRPFPPTTPPFCPA